MDEIAVMQKTTYTEVFKKAVQFSKDNELFLGSGNPNAKLLFIGKEAAIDMEKSEQQYVNEFKKNATDWESNCSNGTQPHAIDNWFMEGRLPTYNPLYPYKGQKNTIESRSANSEIIRGHGGTSKTWHNYQKIIDTMYFNGTPSAQITFHEYAFCSELNQVTANYSHQIPKNIREASILKRKALFQEPFFRGFPITIVAVGHYVKDFDIDLQDVFGSTYDAETSKKYSEGLKNEYINMHYDHPENPTRVLIHTNQLSMVSNALVLRLGDICRAFLKNPKSVVKETI